MSLAHLEIDSYFAPVNHFSRAEETYPPASKIHRPVLLQEVVQWLEPRSGGYYIDATIGLGGHAEAILRASNPSGMLLGIDQDLEALNLVPKHLAQFSGRYHLAHANFSQIKMIAAQQGIESCDGILADLGVSSLQLDTPERGFSLQREGPLDMRMDRNLPLTAEEVLNRYPERDLANLIYRYGEEPRSRVIARIIIRARPLRSTRQLADLIAKTTRSKGYHRIHPATRTFQALRIYVNDELGRLSQFLRSAVDLLACGGRLVVISFHSLEDRIVKEVFRSLSRDCICPPGLPQCVCGNKRVLKILTRKPIQPEPRETDENPRARSAKLRAVQKL